jgi:very-short-patch-repair endonuclease
LQLIIKDRGKSPFIPLYEVGDGKGIMIPYSHKLKQPSRELRKNMTEVEKMLWSKINLKQLNGFLFYRQKPIGGYIADFYCRKAKLVIEVDGIQHFSDQSIEYDKVRDEYMRNAGLTVLRFSNNEVINDISSVLKRIKDKLI